MPIRILTLGLLVCAVPAMPIGAADQPTRKPNVVVIVADDLGYADVGFQGCKDIPTPHLDALAKGGVVCTSGTVTHPFCSPTRAGLLTGRYQQRFGHEYNLTLMPNNKDVGLPVDQTTLADVLKKAGYRTGAVGKWHLGGHASFHPNRRGFDDYFGFLGGGHHYFDHNRFKTDPQKAKADFFSPLLRNETPVEETGYLTDVLGREAAAFVDANKARPFFLYLAFNAPHAPLQATPAHLERLKGIADEKRRTYAAMVCSVDDAVGVVMAKLKEHKLTDDTLVVFLSDNGGPVAVNASSNAPLRGVKGDVYEGGVRVPFVMSWSAKLKPGKFDEPVSSLDVFPTVTTAAGADLPKGVSLDGVDLIPHLTGASKSSLANRTLFWRTGGGESFAARRGAIKLVKNGQQPAELYDLAADIGEAKDLAKDRPETLAALQTELDAWNKTLVAPRWQGPTKQNKK
jgi:arylsulfatase A-like enzyme